MSIAYSYARGDEISHCRLRTAERGPHAVPAGRNDEAAFRRNRRAREPRRRPIADADQEEIFGPVVSVIKFRDEADALRGMDEPQRLRQPRHN